MTRTKDHNIDMNNQILRNKNASKVHNRNSYDYIANDKNIMWYPNNREQNDLHRLA